MAMVDVLCDMKERALKETNPHIMTIATLTGHAVLANGPYTNVMDNGPAKREAFAQGLQSTGDLFGDMFEISTIRREDFDFIKDGSCKWLLAWTSICAAQRSQSSTPTLMWPGLMDHCQALPPAPPSSLLPCTLPIEEHYLCYE